MQKHLLISEIFPPTNGGSGRWFWEVYSRMPQESVIIAAGEHVDQDEFDANQQLHIKRLPLQMKEWGVRSWSGLRGYFRSFRRIRRIVKQQHVSLVHCGRVLPEGVVALALKYWLRIPYICYVHGEDVSTARQSREHTFLVTRVLKNAKYVIANSQNSKRLLVNHWPISGERVVVLHPGVDVNRFKPAARSVGVRKRLGWDDRPVILTVGRLQLRKGQDQLILAMREVIRRHPQALYAIIGDGDTRDYLESLVHEHNLADHVRFHGEPNDEELIECYQQCDVFALPNRNVDGDIEGFGMVLLEAQACARPVIAGDSGGTAETMQTEQTGHVVPCEEPFELAKVVTSLLDDSERRMQMGSAGRRWAVQRFSWDSLSCSAADLFGIKQEEGVGCL